MKRFAAGVMLAAAMAMGCSCGGALREPVPTAVAPLPDYEVHEWGLVRAESGDAVGFGAIAAPAVSQPMIVLKPVLYFHTSRALTLASASVTAPAGGSILEVWPRVSLGPRVAWSDVALDPGGPCAVSALPTMGDPACAALTDFCEVPGLDVARTTDAACVRVGETIERFLFYRGRSTTLTPPLTFERVGDQGEVRVTSTIHDPIPGALIRIWSTGGETRASVLVPPADPLGTITVPAVPPVSSVADARSAIVATMGQIGLSADESAAFMRAWEATLFPADLGVALDLAAVAPIESFLYFLPASSTDDVAVLAFDPPPRVVCRAIAVWSALAASGPSH